MYRERRVNPRQGWSGDYNYRRDKTKIIRSESFRESHSKMRGFRASQDKSSEFQGKEG